MASGFVYYCASEPEFVGKLSVRHDMFVIKTCPLCSEALMGGEALAIHCRRKGDRNHLALEVMET